MTTVELDLAATAIARGAQQKPCELRWLIELLRDRQLDVVVEIGSAQGGTLFAWSAVAEADALLVSIDLPGGAFGGGSSEETARTFSEFVQADQQLRLIRDSSHLASVKASLERELGGREVDFLFIDGDHTYDGVKQDFEMYAPLVRDGGLIAFHDIAVHPTIPACEVDRFWNEIKAEFEHVERLDEDDPSWGGLGVLVYERSRRGSRRRRRSPQRGPSASVVITSFNYDQFLPETIDSALAQTHPDVEVIVVDDGSTDRSREIIAGYGDRVTALLKENGGQASALNAGFAASRGDVVVFLDSDDILLPTAVEEACAALAGSGVVKAHWYLRAIDERRRPLGRVVPAYPIASGELRDEALRLGPSTYYWPPTSGNAWSRRFLERVLPIPEDQYVTCPDSYLAALTPAYGPVKRVNAVLSLYRVHGQNNMNEISQADLIRLFHQESSALERSFRELGFDADAALWRERSPYFAWITQLHETTQDLAALAGDQAPVILVDEDQLRTELHTPRRLIPFLERAGEYYGQPADDDSAIAELERLRAAGARFIAFAWPAFWWLEYYSGLREHLETSYLRTIETDRLIGFDLNGRRTASKR